MKTITQIIALFLFAFGLFKVELALALIGAIAFFIIGMSTKKTIFYDQDSFMNK